jgi:hypothetical protein
VVRHRLCRLSDEKLSRLCVKRVDFQKQTLRVDTGATKDGEGREVAFQHEASFEVVGRLCRWENREDKLINRDDGSAVVDFRKSWANVCAAAGVHGLLFHDLRRSAARNMRNAGMAELEIMRSGGCKNERDVSSHSIVSTGDIDAGMRKYAEHQAAERARVNEVKEHREKQFGQKLAELR